MIYQQPQTAAVAPVATSSIWQHVRAAVVALIVFTLLTGVVYPAVVTGLAQVLFPVQANGSLLRNADGAVVGSSLIGQSFEEPNYFWGRPSATGTFPYNAFNGEALTGSSGSNLGPMNEALIGPEGSIRARIAALRAADPGNTAPIPVDLVTASASGLDPHISPAAAVYQAGRVARSRDINEADVTTLIAQNIEGRTFGMLGEPRVNVLRLNLALDALGSN